MNTELIEKKYMKKNIPDVRVGDTIRVHQKIKEGNKERIQIFEGVVIVTKHGKGLDGSFTVRKISVGVGVEKTFPVHLPTIVKIERIKKAHVRQAKIYYLRYRKGRAARMSGEVRSHKVWEERGAEAELEAIKEEQAEEAQQKVLEEQELAKEQEEKVEEILSAHEDNDQKKPESGQDGGEVSSESAQK